MIRQIEKLKIYYEKAGNGPDLLIVHGWGGRASSFSKLIALLSKEFTVYSVDLPGFGESENPPKDWGVYDYAELVRKFIIDMDIEGCIYLGHSFGGALGVYLSSKYLDLLKKLILCAPSYRRKNIKKKNLESAGLLSDRTRRILYPLRKVFYRIFYPHSDALRYAHLESNFRKIITQDISSEIESITVPTLILWGEDDHFVSVEDAEYLHKRIKGSILKVYPGQGHGVPFSIPEEVASEIIFFVK